MNGDNPLRIYKALWYNHTFVELTCLPATTDGVRATFLVSIAALICLNIVSIMSVFFFTKQLFERLPCVLNFCVLISIIKLDKIIQIS